VIRRAQPWLGTLVDITVDDGTDPRAVTAAFAEIARLHRLMSFHDGASDVSRFNHALPGEVIALDPATLAVLRLAAKMAAASDRMFDVACAPWLVQRQVLPAPAGGQAPPVLRSDALFALEAGEGGVKKLAEGWIDLGGIAKGYIVDAAVDYLQGAGAAGGCVNAGGDVRAFGALPVPVGLRDPRAPGRVARHIMLCEEAMATSGSYFSARQHDGTMVSALLDGRDGRALVAPASASVRAARCAVADALTKVVLATADTTHPALAAWGATAILI
jgi:thiamine biosynthesis lipoprotein